MSDTREGGKEGKREGGKEGRSKYRPVVLSAAKNLAGVVSRTDQ